MSQPQTPAFAVADRFAPFGTTVFTEITRLAVEHGAVNLGQGFPDFDGPAFVKDAAVAAVRSGHNQYARMFGVPPLNEAVAAWWRSCAGVAIDPAANVTVTSGCTEALAAAFLGLVNPGDEVVLFQPFYDSYRACAAMAGARVRYVTLRPPRAGEPAGAQFSFDPDELRAAFAGRPKLILVNTPHNPTGKVFTRKELSLIAELCIEHGTIALTDEVYEALTYDDALSHIRLATLPRMWERTVTCSSLGKTFSLTGWKIGWAVGPEPLMRGVRAAHQFLTFATATPLQHGAAAALNDGAGVILELQCRFRAARDYLAGALRELGMAVCVPAGGYFIMADFSRLAGRLGVADDAAFCRHLITKVGVAAIPPSAFYADPVLGRTMARFAFCKTQATLEEAVRRLGALAG